MNSSQIRIQKLFLPALAVITLGGLILRLLVCMQLSGMDAVTAPASVTDMATYRQFALGILEGNWPQHFYYQPFYYVVFLPVLLLLSAKSVWGVMLVQALLGTAAVWLTGISAARLFGRGAGLLAALLLAASRMHILYTPFMLMAVLQSFWLALLVYLTLCAWKSGHVGYWLGAALVLSAAVLTRGNVILLLPGLLALLLWRTRAKFKRGLTVAVVMTALVYLPQLPFSWRNYQYHGRWTGPSSAQDAVLALGNNPEAPPGWLDYPRSYEEWMRRAQLPGAERQSVPSQMLDWLRREPLALPELKLRAFLLFWNNLEIPNNVSFAQALHTSSVLRFPGLMNFAVIGTLGLSGALLALYRRRRSPRTLFCIFTLVVFMLATVLFYILARFRIPILPLLCIFGGYSAAQFLKFLLTTRRERMPRGRAYAIIFTLFFSLLFTTLGFPVYNQVLEKQALTIARPRGVTLESPEQTFVFDYGPFPGGGWGAMLIPAYGMHIQKMFMLPSENASLEDAVLRLAIHTTRSSSECQVRVFHNQRMLNLGKVNAEPRAQGINWVEIPLGNIQVNSESVNLEIHLLPTRGNPLLWVDFARHYKRGLVPHPDTPELFLAAEPVIELGWKNVSVQ